MAAKIQQRQESHLGELVDEICEQIHAGNMIDLDELIEQHPELKDQLRKIYPTLLAMANWDSNDKNLRLAVDNEDQIANQPIGDYQIIRELGRGGMGIVYEAEQLSVSRRVALKVLPLASLITGKALHRFHNEVRAAAALDHPNIVTIHTVGEDRGINYFAMQLIRGQSMAAVIRALRKSAQQNGSVHGASIDQIIACEDNADPGPGDAPALAQDETQAETMAGDQSKTAGTKFNAAYFRNVCRLMIQASEALEHAHERGVIHRDVKPGNLLLDQDGNVFVADFGLARIETDPGITMTGDLLGTFRYMSPEQVLSNRVIIDHRTDVYSLGATLYELLTLQPMISAEGRPQIIKQISLEDPTPPRKINGNIPIDLETVVLKSTRKDPDERYQSARELYEDLQHYLDNKPVTAKRPTAVQRFNKWTLRNPAIMWAAILLLALLTIGATISTGLIWQANGQTQQALASAQQRADENRAVVDFLINDMLAASTPEVSGGRKLTVGQVLANAEKKLDGKFENHPLVEASVRQALGKTYLSLSDFWTAEKHLHRARQIRMEILGFDHPDTLLSAREEALSLVQQGRTEEGMRLAQDTLEAQVEVLGENHRDTLFTKMYLALSLTEWGELTRAEQMLKQVIEAQRRQNASANLQTLKTRTCLAWNLLRSKKHLEAKQVLDELEADCIETFGSDHPGIIWVQYKQALLLPEAERHQYLVELLEASRIVLGDDSHWVMFIRLKNAASDQDLNKGQALLEEILARRREKPGDFNPSSLMILIELEKNLRKQKKFAEAEQRYGELVDAFNNRAEMQLNEARDLNSAAWLMLKVPQEYKETYDPTVALANALRACTLAEKNGDPHFANYLNTLALAEHETGNTALAIETQKRAIKLSRPDINDRSAYERNLEKYEAALNENK